MVCLMKSIVLFGLALTMGAARADDLATVREAMQQKTKWYVAALTLRDASWFQDALTPDFKETQKGADGKLKSFTKTETIDLLKQMFAALTSVDRVSASVKSVRLEGRSAVIVTETMFRGRLAGPQGKVLAIVDDSTDEETWVPDGADWKVKFVRTLKETAFVDGKPINGSR
jgi:hypothetical protein